MGTSNPSEEQPGEKGVFFPVFSVCYPQACDGFSNVAVITAPLPEAISPLPPLFAQASQAVMGETERWEVKSDCRATKSTGRQQGPSIA